ncbi:hypothetical protein BDY19DRAFT_294457 [Irpex rosettiformis]|uniref:Uncharacterized protein n=1 Tax=Irpex rosettiformis TaxID=378272 RepID=A0ACB8UIB3_9APHY|nr:hypothetical protein BDY19DRAFT_294457 [Irpex rosettiformis]
MYDDETDQLVDEDSQHSTQRCGYGCGGFKSTRPWPVKMINIPYGTREYHPPVSALHQPSPSCLDLLDIEPHSLSDPRASSLDHKYQRKMPQQPSFRATRPPYTAHSHCSS